MKELGREEKGSSYFGGLPDVVVVQLATVPTRGGIWSSACAYSAQRRETERYSTGKRIRHIQPSRETKERGHMYAVNTYCQPRRIELKNSHGQVTATSDNHQRPNNIINTVHSRFPAPRSDRYKEKVQIQFAAHSMHIEADAACQSSRQGYVPLISTGWLPAYLICHFLIPV